MNIRKQHRQAGFTLFEMIIVIFLFAILLVGLLNIFDWQQKVYNFEQAEIAATGTARNAMNSLTFGVAQGSAILASRTIDGTTYTTGGSTVVLQLPSYDSATNLIPNTYDYLVYSASGTDLHQITEAAVNSERDSGTKLLTGSLESFNLTYNNGDPTLASQVGVDLTTRAYYRGNNSVTVNLAETIFLRNR
jgi:prepilin-type N-terminal cleavage/methylation domain-containing protein